jgi:uncharacterized tellurite resistance protein B-like protein
MIIWGSRGITSSQAKGLFHCPQCEQQRSYDHKKVRRFFTLYFIPLIPLETLGEYVECQFCKGTYKQEVLRYDPRAQEEALRQAFDYALQRSLVVVMLADGPAQEVELRALASLYRSHGGRSLGPQELQAVIDKAAGDTRTLEQHLGPLAAQLNTTGKERLLGAAVQMAAADGSLQPQELETLEAMAGALGVSGAHLKGIVSENTSSLLA